jgi:hypothetical protein
MNFFVLGCYVYVCLIVLPSVILINNETKMLCCSYTVSYQYSEIRLIILHAHYEL